MAPVGDGVDDGVGEVLLDEAAIRAEVARLGALISADYAGKSLHLVGVLKGSAVFLADLLRALTVPATIDFISIVPYGQVTASGVVRIRKDLDEPIEGKDVLVVEGICASGLSLSYLLRNFETRRPATSPCTTSAARSRTSSWSATASTRRSSTAISRISPASPSRPPRRAHLLRCRPRLRARGSSS